MSILVVNAGSSSLKFGLFPHDAGPALASGGVDWKGGSRQTELVLRPAGAAAQRLPVEVTDHRAAVGRTLQGLQELGLLTAAAPLRAVGHRVVHGGTQFRVSVRIDGAVKTALAQLAELAPLHNPPALQGIEAAELALPGVPQVAVFDTAFYADLPPQAVVYPLPYEWFTAWGIRRFGFHGISHAYCTGRAAALLQRPLADVRLVICHLGNGCSATAVRGGTAIATTMGYTPLEGLMMGTRSGSVDPGLLLHVQQCHGLTPAQLDQALNQQSGLLGVSGVSSDYRLVEAAAHQGNERAQLALQIYADRVRSAIGALAVTLGGMDALVFTAGVGENSARLRAAACAGLQCLGLKLDAARNETARPDAGIAAADSSGRILVLHTQEELLIAEETRRVAEDQQPGAAPR